MRTIETKVFKFEELSDDSKQVAREKYNQDCGADNAQIELEHVQSVIKEVCATLGVQLDDKYGLVYSVGDRGDFAGFNGEYSFVKLGASKVKREWSQDELLRKVCDALISVRAQCKGKVLTATMRTNERAGHMTVECFDHDGFECPTNGRMADIASELEQAIEDLAHWAYKTLLQGYEWVSTEEYIDEALIANEYEFTEDGQMI